MLGCRMKDGFTIIELSLSLVFISTLSLMVVVVIMNSVSAYHKSITLNQLNTVGTSVIDDIRASIQASSAVGLRTICDRIETGTSRNDCNSNNGLSFVSVVKYGNVKTRGGNSISTIGNNKVPLFGAFCTGSYSYLWNSGYFFSNDYEVQDGVEASRLRYKKEGEDSESEIRDYRLLKVRDESRAVCAAAIGVENGRFNKNRYKVTSINGGGSIFNIALDGVAGSGKATLSEEPQDLLTKEGGLALYNLTTNFALQAGVGKNVYYYSTFVLGTIQGGPNVMEAGDNCKTPEGGSDVEANFDYCAINKFNFAAMANGGYNGN